MKKIIIGTAVLLSGCVVEPAHVYVPPPEPVYVAPQPVYQAPAPQPVVSVYLDPPLEQPAPVRIGWAPPPILVESPPPLPYDGAVWIGGYWTWQGTWVWAHGRWAPPPRPGFTWCHPYYENRGGSVVFINGFWAAPGVSFVAPGLNVNISLGVVAAGVIAGPRPIGPEGVFIPAPPGSHLGLIVPAPIGTAPAVVTSAPPIVQQGMRITNNTTVNNINNSVHNTTNITNVTNVTNVTIVAPASATANGQAVNTSVPAQAHLAAKMTPVVKAYAPEPASAKPIPVYTPGRPLPTLPAAQTVHPEVNQALMHQQARPAPTPTSAPAQNQPAQASQPQQRPAPAPAPAAQPQQNQPKAAPQQNGNMQEREDVERRQPQQQQAPQSKPAPAPTPKPAQQQEPRPQPEARPQQERQQQEARPAPAPKPAQQPANKPKPEAKEQKPHEEGHGEKREEGRGEKHERE